MLSLRVFFRTTIFWIFCLVLGFAYLRFQDTDGTYLRMLFPHVGSVATVSDTLSGSMVDTGMVTRLDDIDQKIDGLNDSIVQLMTLTMQALDQSKTTGDQNIDSQPTPSITDNTPNTGDVLSGSTVQSGSRE